MKEILRLFSIFLFCFVLVCLIVEPRAEEEELLTDDNLTVLKICEEVIHLFKHFPDSVWPGYDLSNLPFIVYVPERFVLLFNVDQEIEGFTSYPEKWPDLGTKVLYHPGQYKNLVGQLVFNFEIGDKKMVAVGFPQKFPESFEFLEAFLFGHIVHEAFHQFQYDTFGEIPWEREER